MVTSREILQRLQSDDPRALPRLVTLVENEDLHGLEALDALYPLTGKAHVVGVTGPPGAGKSTLIADLVIRIRASGRRVAVLAVDPSSPLSGGAVLGDRIRMMALHADSGLFMRSMASRGRQGGLAWATAELVHLLDAAGFPMILVETVGTGQDGTDIASLADTVLVVEAPGLGDGVQA
ncbi:MAG: ArgK/MeaB family GTPase, partial [Gammaproteobacteria bacterium]